MTALTAPELITWLEQHVATLLELPADAVDVEATFADQGMSSIQAVQLTAELEDHLGAEVPPTAAYEFPSIRELAEHLSREGL